MFLTNLVSMKDNCKIARALITINDNGGVNIYPDL